MEPKESLTCWAASCERVRLLYVFEVADDDAGRWLTGRLRGHECEALGPGWCGSVRWLLLVRFMVRLIGSCRALCMCRLLGGK